MTPEITIKIEQLKTELPLFFKKLSPIAEKYQTTEETLVIELLKFFQLITVTKQTLSPSYIVDLAWHEFILFTRYYDSFCNDHYDKFIHHTPSENEDKNRYRKTIQNYILHFGTPPAKIWGEPAQIEGESADCGACHN